MFILQFVEGIVIGFLMAVPIGAVGILCIHRTLDRGRRQGYITGLAGASADLLFSLVSASGIKLISDFITDYQHEIRLIGGILLLLMGVFLIRSSHRPVVEQENAMDETKMYFSTLILAITNPLVMFSYAAALTIIGAAKLDYGTLSVLLAGVFVGSFLWFMLISNLAHKFRTTITPEKLTVSNRAAGVLLILIGAAAVWNGAQGLV